MRTAAIAFASLAVAARCAAYPIEWYDGGIYFSSLMPADPPRTARLQVYPRHQPLPTPSLTSWEIPDIFPADSGRTWTLREADATAAGFDWAILTAAFAEPENYILNSTFIPAWYPVPRFNGGGGIGTSGLRFINIDRIEFRLLAFADLGTGHSVNYRHVIIGDGYYVPEPLGLLLFLVGCTVTVLGLRTRR